MVITKALKHCIFIALMLFVLFKLWSFWQTRTIEVLHEDKNDFGSVWVYEEEGARCMSFTRPSLNIPRQTCMMLDNPKVVVFDYAKVFLGTLLFNKLPEKILLVGLGGGAVVKALNELVPDATIDVVEINPLVVDMAKKYFNFNDSKESDQNPDGTVKKTSNNVFIDDGVVFVQNATDNMYDLVLIDAFDGEYIPLNFLTKEFVNNVKRIMKKDAVVAMNTYLKSKYFRLESELFNSTFGGHCRIHISGNSVIMASNNEDDKGKLDESQVQHNAELLKDPMEKMDIDVNLVLDLIKKSFDQ